MAKFEDNLISLEAVVEKLERGDLSLEDSVRLFEEGIKLSSACKTELDAAEGRIQLLVDHGNGKVRTTDLEVEDDPSVAEDNDDEE
jgi:exodeoxyribonuclease VII small subunit